MSHCNVICHWLGTFTKSSVHENHQTCQTFPIARPKCLMRDFTILNTGRIYKAHRTNVWVMNHGSFFGNTEISPWRSDRKCKYIYIFIFSEIYSALEVLISILTKLASDYISISKPPSRASINSLWPSDSIHVYGNKDLGNIGQVMACCLMAPSHYLDQCWLLISEDPWYSPKSNFNFSASARATILQNEFEELYIENYCYISQGPMS